MSLTYRCQLMYCIAKVDLKLYNLISRLLILIRNQARNVLLWHTDFSARIDVNCHSWKHKECSADLWNVLITEALATKLCISYFFDFRWPHINNFDFSFQKTKNQIWPKMLPKKVSLAFLFALSSKWGLETFYYAFNFYWPNVTYEFFFLKKIR